MRWSVHRNWLLLLTLLLTSLAGVGLRIDQIGLRSLWADELFTVGIALFHPMVPEPGKPWFERKQVLHISDGDSFLTAKAAEQSPPLNDLLEKASLNLLGAKEWVARLPAGMAAGLLLVWAAALAWRERDPPSRQVLAWNVLLLALYPILVHYAKDGRAYSLGASFVGAALILWWLRWRWGLARWEPLGTTEIAFWVAACYSHYNAAVVVVLIGLIELWACWQRRSKQGFRRALALALLFLPWVLLNAHAILFTSKGGVAWGNVGIKERALMALEHVMTAIHWPWMALTVCVLVLTRWKFVTGGEARTSPSSGPSWMLPAMAVLFLVAASMIVAKAGMAHPRYYLFACPILALWMAMALANITRAWQQFVVAAMVLALSAPTLWNLRSSKNEDFRAMTLMAISGAPGETPFVYPWQPNRNMYRVYLEWKLGNDPRSRMHGLSSANDYQMACEKLAAHSRLAVIGHDSGHAVMDGFYQHCGHHWPTRKRWQFDNTFAEHWIRE